MMGEAGCWLRNSIMESKAKHLAIGCHVGSVTIGYPKRPQLTPTTNQHTTTFNIVQPR